MLQAKMVLLFLHSLHILTILIFQNLNTNTLELFFNYDGNFIENYIELHLILLEKIKSVYTIRDNLLKENFKFFSKSIEPHIIVLEKYLKVIFKL